MKWLASLALSILALVPCQAVGETYGETLARICPAAYRVDKEQTRANALADDAQYSLAKKAAGLYYDCAQNQSNPYYHDVAYLWYLFSLSVSVPSDDRKHLFSMLLVVKTSANELAAKTHDPDIRTKALHVRDTTAQQISSMMSAPSSVDTPSPGPEDTPTP